MHAGNVNRHALLLQYEKAACLDKPAGRLFFEKIYSELLAWTKKTLQK